MPQSCRYRACIEAITRTPAERILVDHVSFRPRRAVPICHCIRMRKLEHAGGPGAASSYCPFAMPCRSGVNRAGMCNEPHERTMQGCPCPGSTAPTLAPRPSRPYMVPLWYGVPAWHRRQAFTFIFGVGGIAGALHVNVWMIRSRRHRKCAPMALCPMRQGAGNVRRGALLGGPAPAPGRWRRCRFMQRRRDVTGENRVDDRMNRKLPSLNGFPWNGQMDSTGISNVPNTVLVGNPILFEWLSHGCAWIEIHLSTYRNRATVY